MVLEKSIETQNGISYQDYLTMIEDLIARGKTTGDNHSTEMVDYTRLNFQRMKRLNKSAAINEELKNAINHKNGNYLFLVLTEAWCGDAAQNIPVIAKLAELNNNIELRLLLRDENPSLMDQYLTNGGRAIPKLICWDKDSKDEAFVWGPRPSELQNIVMEYRNKEDKEPFEQFAEKVHGWYNKNKTQSLQQELLLLLERLK